MTAYTKVCFRTTPEDGRELAHLFPGESDHIRPEDIDPHPVEFLLAHGSHNHYVNDFVQHYLRPLKMRWGTTRAVEISDTGFSAAGFAMDMFNLFTSPKGAYNQRENAPKVENPTLEMNALLRDVMKSGDPRLPVPYKAALGYSNCGQSFFQELRKHSYLLHDRIEYPPQLVIHARDGVRWTRPPQNGMEQLYHFLFHLRLTMAHLAAEPIGKTTTSSPAEIARMLVQLHKRTAFVRGGEDIGTIYTHNTPPLAAGQPLYERLERIKAQTRAKYCHPRGQIERGFGGDDPPSPSGPGSPNSPNSPNGPMGPTYGEVRIRHRPNSDSLPPTRWETIDP